MTRDVCERVRERERESLQEKTSKEARTCDYTLTTSPFADDVRVPLPVIHTPSELTRLYRMTVLHDSRALSIKIFLSFLLSVLRYLSRIRKRK